MSDPRWVRILVALAVAIIVGLVVRRRTNDDRRAASWSVATYFVLSIVLRFLLA
jgi:uncharacterized membrane-anchored protein YhcB (DUF1043 family)